MPWMFGRKKGATVAVLGGERVVQRFGDSRGVSHLRGFERMGWMLGLDDFHRNRNMFQSKGLKISMNSAGRRTRKGIFFSQTNSGVEVVFCLQ